MTDPAARVAAVRAAYNFGRVPKMLIGNSEAAISCLRRAENIALDGPPLGDSLLALVRYRLGHVYLRQATHLDKGDAVTVSGNAAISADHAVTCFEQATRSHIVAPWAFPYLLAALNTRSKLPNPPDDQHARTRAAWAAACARANRRAVPFTEQDDPIPLQRPSFNMLELATFFLGYSVDDLLRDAGGFSANAGPTISSGPSRHPTPLSPGWSPRSATRLPASSSLLSRSPTRCSRPNRSTGGTCAGR